MVKVEKVLTKDGKPYLTKEGKELQEYTLEEGDIFVSLNDHPIMRKASEERKFADYLLKCKLKDSEGNEFGNKNSEGIFVKLTKGQYERLQKFAEDGELTQKKLEAYKYNNNYGEYISIKKLGTNKKPIDL